LGEKREAATFIADSNLNKWGQRSNIQFGYIVYLPWGTKGIDSRESLRLIAESWEALKPLLDAVRGTAASSSRR
jgi:hypothetical protein